MPHTVRLHPTERRRSGTCPSCRTAAELIVMRPEADASIDMRRELILLCPHCQQLSLPAAVLKRVLGFAVLLPFFALLAAGAATGVWILVEMIRARALEPGFAFVAAILIGAGVAGGRLALRSLRRLFVPGGLLPLVRTGATDYRYESHL